MRSAPLLVLLFAVAGCAADPTAPAVPAQASFATVTTEQFFQSVESQPFTIETTCGENIDAAVGTVHFFRQVLETSDGLIVRTRVNLQGVVGYGDVTGAEYRLISDTKLDQVGEIPSPGTTLVIRNRVRAISKGPAANFVGEAVTTVLFRDGLAPLITIEVTGSCQG